MLYFESVSNVIITHATIASSRPRGVEYENSITGASVSFSDLCDLIG
jgi:hypothetical protein